MEGVWFMDMYVLDEREIANVAGGLTIDQAAGIGGGAGAFGSAIYEHVLS